MALQAARGVIGNSCVVRIQIGFRMAAVTRPGAGSGRVAGGALVVGSPMVGRERVVKTGSTPGAGGMALRTLSGIMAGGSILRMAAYTIGGVLSSVIECGGQPGTGGMAF